MASADGNMNPAKDEMNSNAAPIQCASGCGFFGNASTGGMCSKCYKETIAKQQASAAPAAPAAPPAAEAKPPAPAAPAPAPVPVAAPPVIAEEVPAAKPAASPAASSSTPAPMPAVEAPAATVCGVIRASEEEGDGEPPKKVQANTSRCWTCNRKIGLLGFQCKCEYYFCAEHRYSDRHECAFDYKKQGKNLLTKANPTIAPAKMETM